jgi:hypothetical protein
MFYSFILASLLISLASSQSKIEKGPLLWSDEFNYEGNNQFTFKVFI